VPEASVSEDSVNASDSNSSNVAASVVATDKRDVSTTLKNDYKPMNSWPVVIGTLFAMVLVIVALGWFARRFNGLNIARNKDMAILSTLSVGTRERITLVKVKDQTLLLGVTNQQISCLHAFDSDVGDDDSSEPIKSDFSMTLRGLLNKEKGAFEKSSDVKADSSAGGAA
jgi:flagellar biosynthetic protein FliO